MDNNYLSVLKSLLNYYEIVFNNKAGYEYDLLKNDLLLPPSEISEYKQIGINQQKADRILRLECFSINNELISKIHCYEKLDALSKFVLIALAKLISVSKVVSRKQLHAYLQEGRFTQAANELELINANRRLITILKTGKVR